MIILIALIIVCLLVYFVFYKDNFVVCNSCDTKYVDSNVILNPFSWPYSGSPCVDDIYLAKANTFNKPPLTHLSTPDHVELI